MAAGLGVEIVKVQVGRYLESFEDPIHQKCVRSSPAYRPGDSTTRRIALKMELVAQSASSEADSCPAPGLGLDGPYLQHARGPATIPGGKGSFVDRHLFEHLALERGEKAKKMALAVNRDPVQKDQVLVRASSPDIYSRKTLVPSLDSWKQLDGFQHVSLTKKRQAAFHHSGRDNNGAGPARCLSLFGGNHGLPDDEARVSGGLGI